MAARREDLWLEKKRTEALAGRVPAEGQTSHFWCSKILRVLMPWHRFDLRLLLGLVSAGVWQLPSFPTAYDSFHSWTG